MPSALRSPIASATPRLSERTVPALSMRYLPRKAAVAIGVFSLFAALYGSMLVGQVGRPLNTYTRPQFRRSLLPPSQKQLPRGAPTITSSVPSLLTSPDATA